MAGIVLLAWVINGLLLRVVGRFLGTNTSLFKIWLSAFAGASMAGMSLLPELVFLRTHLGYAAVMLMMCTIAFGIHRKLFLQFGLFMLLHISIGGLSGQTAEPLRMVLGATGIGLACWLSKETKRLVPVELTYGQTQLKLNALYDTGNTLLDPITGQGVLILDAPSAQYLTGLTLQQLNAPVESLGILPGLRLIPYHTVGNSGFLLALRLARVRIGRKEESIVVAFAPQTFGKDYQALTGGRV